MAKSQQANDLHLERGQPVAIRVHGELRVLRDFCKLVHKDSGLVLVSGATGAGKPLDAGRPAARDQPDQISSLIISLAPSVTLPSCIQGKLYGLRSIPCTIL